MRKKSRAMDKVGLVTACDKAVGSTVEEGSLVTLTIGAQSTSTQAPQN